MLIHLLTNFKIQKFYHNEPKFNGVYSRNKMKYRAYVKSLDEYESIGAHSIALYVNGNTEKHLMMQHILIVLELNIFRRNYRKQKYNNIYL